MDKIIIYGSKYGTTKSYAEELSNKTGIKAVSYEKNINLNDYNVILYLGALYAGGVLGLSKTLKKIKNASNKKIIISTVGLSDPTDIYNISNIEKSMKKQLPEDVINVAKIFHLRGGIDYSKLGFTHKTMMSLLYKKAIKIPEKEKTAETKAMIETYNKRVNFVDFNSLDKIIEEINII